MGGEKKIPKKIGILKGRVIIGCTMSVSYIRIVKAETGDKGNEGRAMKGFQSLTPYMTEITKQFDNKEIDITDLYERIIFANNILLGKVLGVDEAELFAQQEEEEDEDAPPSMMEDPIVTPPIMNWLQRLTSKYPQLKEVRQQDEELNGESLFDTAKFNRKIRPDISSFLADPFYEGRKHRTREMNGIFNILDRSDHPIAPALGKKIGESDRVFEPRERKPRKRIGIQQEMDDLARQQRDALMDLDLNNRQKTGIPFDKLKEYLSRRKGKEYTHRDSKDARDVYDKLFAGTEFQPRGPKSSPKLQVSVNSLATNRMKDLINGLAEREQISHQDAISVLQDNFNDYMTSLTGVSGFGGTNQNAITPALEAAAKEHGTATGIANIPDYFLSPFITYRETGGAEKSPFSKKVRQAIKDKIGNTENFHMAVLQSIDNPRGNLNITDEDDPNRLVEITGASGTKDDITSRAKEARMPIGTDMELSKPEEQKLDSERAKIKMDKKLADIERQYRLGDIDDYQYRMAMTLARAKGHQDKHNIDPDDLLGGLTGDDFEPSHPLYGMSPQSIAEATNTFVDNLIGTTRLMNEVKLMAFEKSDAQTPEEKKEVINKLATLRITGEDIGNIIARSSAKQNLDEAEEKFAEGKISQHEYNMARARSERISGISDEDEKRYDELTHMIDDNGHINKLDNLAARLERSTKRMANLGLNNVDIFNAALRYSNADMSVDGYNQAMRLLNQKAKDGGLKGYPVSRLLSYLERTGKRAAIDNEHHKRTAEQQAKFRKNHHARMEARENALENEGFQTAGTERSPTGLTDEEMAQAFGFGFLDDSHSEDILSDEEECQSCAMPRFTTREAEKARLHSPLKRGKTPYHHKVMSIPDLDEYQNKGTGRDDKLDLVGAEGAISLAAIARHIFPNNSDYSTDRINKRTEGAKNKFAMEMKIKGELKKAIKNAVISGNPNAADIFKKFGLHRKLENTIASGGAGLSNRELSSIPYFLPNDSSYDRYHERHRLRQLASIRMDALQNAVSFVKDLQAGEYQDKEGKPLKVSNRYLSKEGNRKDILDMLGKQKLITTRSIKKRMAKKQETIDSYNEAHNRYNKQQFQLDGMMNETKPKFILLNENTGEEITFNNKKDAEERMKRYSDPKSPDYLKESYSMFEEAGRLQSPEQIAILEQRQKALKDKYGKMLTHRKKLLTMIEKDKKELAAIKESSANDELRRNEFVRGAFAHSGTDLVKIAKMKDDDDIKSALSDLYTNMYGNDNNDSIIQADINGNISRDFTYNLDKYKMGRMGEMAGTGVRGISNNIALPRVNDINQLIAHRSQLGLPLNDEQKNHAEKVMGDSRVAENMALDNFDLPDLDDLSDVVTDHSYATHEHHDSEPNEIGLLTEAEMARRHQNSHFTRDSEEDIEKGDIDAAILKLMSNWENHGARLCGTCHGHTFVSKDEAAAYLRHHIPELEGLDIDSPKMKKWIAKHMRPRGFGSFADHPRSDTMEPHEHNQFACPHCDHANDEVVGGKCANGICPDCNGSGVRDPARDAEIQEGYKHRQDGTMVPGKNHHYSHNSATSQKFDYLNQMLTKIQELKGKRLPYGPLSEDESDEVPHFLREFIQPKALPWDIYGDHLESGRYTSMKQLMDARKKKHIEPLELDEIPDELPTIPPAKLPSLPTIGGEKEEQLPTISLTGTHDTVMDAHHKSALRKRVERLAHIAKATGQSASEVDNLVDKILKHHPSPHDMHNNEDHYLHELMHRLQEYAEGAFEDSVEDIKLTNSESAAKKLIAQRNNLPVDKDGDFNITPQDIFTGKLPMMFPFYDPLTFSNGRFLSPAELKEELFSPGTKKEPKAISNAYLEKLFANDRKSLKALKRVTAGENYNERNAKEIANALEGVGEPMATKTVSNIKSDELNKLLEEFGLGEQDAVSATGYGFSEEGLAAFNKHEYYDEKKEKKVKLSNITNLLTAPDKYGKMRALDNQLTSNISKQTKPMWKQYVMLKAVKAFLENHNNELDYPNIPEMTAETYYDTMLGDANMFGIVQDEAAKLLGFEDEADLEKNLNGIENKTIRLPDGNEIVLKPAEFKAKIMQGVTKQDVHKYPFGVLKFTPEMGEDGEPTGEFKESHQSITPTQLMNNNFNNAQLDADRKTVENMTRVAEYKKYPNWHYEKDLTKMLQGQEDVAGYDNYEELSQLFKDGLLDADTQNELTTMMGLSAMTHPTLQPPNYDAMMKYDYAANQTYQQNQATEQARLQQERQKDQQMQQQAQQQQAQQALEGAKEGIE